MIEIRTRLKEIKHLESLVKNNRLEEMDLPISSSINNKKFIEGISIIIPVYKGIDYLSQLLKTFSGNNNLEVKHEIILIFNGLKSDVARDKEYAAQLLEIYDVRTEAYFLSSDIGAAKARNKGIEFSKMSHTLFLDVDDNITSATITCLKDCLTNKITLFELQNFENNISDNGRNIINDETKSLKGKDTTDYHLVAKKLSMNGAKLIPTKYLKQIKFDEDLKSGEDVVLMMKIIAEFKPIIYILDSEEAVYQRYLTKNSVSRQLPSFEFNVTQRYKVIKILAELLDSEDEEGVRQLIINRMKAQAGFINRYLKEHPERYKEVIDMFEDIEAEYLPFEVINKDLATTLVIGYCFAPYSDTSGIVLAKRIRERSLPCDIISNNMDNVRQKDYTIKSLAAPYTDRHFELQTVPSFKSWTSIEQFINKGFNRVKNKEYSTVYSRVLWPASHYLALKYKMKNPSVKWIAEFSDPVLYDIKNNERYSKIKSRRFLNTIKKNSNKKWHPFINDNLFNMTEIIAFIFADELVFTNEIQKETMINRIDDKDLQFEMNNKAVVKVHPTLDKKFYYREDALIELDNNKYNLGYFGNFYETRSVEDLIMKLKNNDKLAHNHKEVCLNIFTSKPNMIDHQDYDDEHWQVKVNPYLSYLEFLNSLTEFDALIVADANTQGIKDRNPYLPSKLSDYLGTDKQIIALVEEGSSMAQLNGENIFITY